MPKIGFAPFGRLPPQNFWRVSSARSALDELEVVAFILEITFGLRDEHDLIARNGNRIDAKAGLGLGARDAARGKGCCTQRAHDRAPADDGNHVDELLSLLVEP